MGKGPTNDFEINQFLWKLNWPTWLHLCPEMQVNKHLMTGPERNSEFCIPETLNVPRGEAEGNIEVEGKQNSLFPINITNTPYL